MLVCLTSKLAEPMWKQLARHSHFASLGIPDLPCRCCSPDRIHHLPRNRLLGLILFHSLFQCSQSSVSELLPAVLSLSLWSGWELILSIRLTFQIWARSPRRSLPGNAGGNVDLSDNLNAAAPSHWKNYHGTVRISDVFKLYPTAVICQFWAGDSFCVALGF